MIVELRAAFEAEGGRFYRLTCEAFDLVACGPADKPIPTGVYRMRRDHTGEHRHWVILGGELGLAGSGKRIQQAEFHVGNFPTIDSDACILPGTAIRWLEHEASGETHLAVANSGKALRRMHRVLDHTDEHDLVVLPIPEE